MSYKTHIRLLIKKITYRFFEPTAVLMLHGINDQNEKFSLPYTEFTGLINSFDKKNFISIDELGNPQKAGICITFDDGYEDVYTEVYPFLKMSNVPFTTFVSVGNIGKPGYMTKEQIIEISDNPLVTVGSHCVNHIPLKGRSKSEQLFEMEHSKNVLEGLINRKVDYIAYPYGQNDAITRGLCKSFYKLGFVAGGGMINKILMRNRTYIRRLNVDYRCCKEVGKELKNYFD